MAEEKLNWLLTKSRGHRIKLNDDTFDVVNVIKRNGEWHLAVEDFYETLMFIPFSYITEYEVIA